MLPSESSTWAIIAKRRVAPTVQATRGSYQPPLPCWKSHKLCSWWGWERIVTSSWWRHQMETFSALLALCEGNQPVIGGCPSQRPVTELWYFLLSALKQTVEQTGDLRLHHAHYDVPVIMEGCMRGGVGVGRNQMHDDIMTWKLFSSILSVCDGIGPPPAYYPQ